MLARPCTVALAAHVRGEMKMWSAVVVSLQQVLPTPVSIGELVAGLCAQQSY